MKKSSFLNKVLLAVLAIILSMNCALTNSFKTVRAATTVTSAYDDSGYAVKSFETSDLVVSLDTKIPYALSGYSLADYYGWYPAYFQSSDGKTDYYKILQEKIGDASYIALDAEIAEIMNILVVSLCGTSYDGYYSYICCLVEETTDTEEDTTKEVTYLNVVSETGTLNVDDYTAIDTYFSLTATIDYACYGSNLKAYYDYYGASPYFTEKDGTDVYKLIEEYMNGQEVVKVDDTLTSLLKRLTATFYQSESYAGYYYYFLLYVEDASTAGGDSAEEVTYLNVVSETGSLNVVDYTAIDTYFSLTAKYDYALYGSTLKAYYDYYGASPYFTEEDGTDVYKLIEEYMNGQSVVKVDDTLTALLKRLISTFYQGDYADYYYYFLLYIDDSADTPEPVKYTFNYVAEQYKEYTPNGDPIVGDFSDDTEALACAVEQYNDGNLYVSLTDPYTYALYGYTMEEYIGWYPSYFGSLPDALEGKTDRFIQVDASIKAGLEELSYNWYGSSDYWYCFTYIDTGYIELYDEDGYTNKSGYLMEELYVNLNQELQYALYDIDFDFAKTAPKRPESLASAYAAEDWAGLFTVNTRAADLYQQLKAAVAGTEDEFGFAPVTDEVVSILKQMVYNRWAKYGDYTEYWDVFTYYKAIEDESELAEAVANDEAVGETKLVYGDESLADEDAYIVTLYGDGFDETEQDDFYKAAEDLANYLMETKPFDEVAKAVKIYAIGITSNESGVSNENVTNPSDINSAENVVDTYFSSTYWGNGMQRLVVLPKDGEMKLNALTRVLVPASDVSGVIVNSTVYGGSGGSYLTSSLNSSANEIFVHELGHTLAGLSDEYYAGSDYEHENVNMTQESDPEKVRWAAFIGVGDVSVYPYTTSRGKTTGWYRPSETCKMQYLGTEYPFCAVCAEQIRKSVADGSNVPLIFFQPYNNTVSSEDGIDITPWLILRQDDAELTVEEAGSAATLTYFDAEGHELENAPTEDGEYEFKVEYAGGDDIDEGTYTGKLVIENGVLKSLVFCEIIEAEEEPVETPEEPTETPEEPTETPEEPTETPEEPAETPEEPAETPEEPAETPEEPTETPEEPTETPEEPEEPIETPEEVPNTGDIMNINLMVAVMVASGCATVYTALLAKKKENLTN